MGQLLPIGEMLTAHARLQPHKLATRDSRRSLTFGQWNDRACRAANALLGGAVASLHVRAELLALTREDLETLHEVLSKLT